MLLLSKGDYLAIAIVVLIVLAVIFIITFILYKKTPVPKGCEDLKEVGENCKACPIKDCGHRLSEESEEKNEVK